MKQAKALRELWQVHGENTVTHYRDAIFISLIHFTLSLELSEPQREHVDSLYELHRLFEPETFHAFKSKGGI